MVRNTVRNGEDFCITQTRNEFIDLMSNQNINIDSFADNEICGNGGTKELLTWQSTTYSASGSTC